MKKLKEFEFGFADAEKEFNRIPKIFESAFYDPRSMVENLINKHHFLLIGRKGVGKSAVSAKIRSDSAENDEFETFQLQLNDFEYSTFAKTSIDKDSNGTQKYKESWEFILLLSCTKILYNKFKMSESQELNNLIKVLENMGFNMGDNLNYKNNITRLSKLKVGVSVVQFDAEFENEFGYKPDSFLERLSSLNERMLDVIKNIYMNNKKLIIIIDGVDDILRFKKNQLNILSSLIRSVDYLNEKFYNSNSPFKIILCIREDILAKITDPDLNKIKRDGSITIDWSSRIDDLKEVVELRFTFSGLGKDSVKNYWYEIFPRKIRDKDSWMHVLEHTLYKPRDILQFLKTCQDLYPNKESLVYNEITTATKNYSKDYFIEEMKNEITGFISDDLINILPSVFQRIGDRKFTLNEFSRHYKEQLNDDSKKQEDLKYLLLLLFESGYIGQLLDSTGKYGQKNKSVIFKYRNRNSQIDYSQTFIVHKGIQVGLGVRIR